MATDLPTVVLIQNLKQRRLLDSTIIFCSGEFDRLPSSRGRDQNCHACSLLLSDSGFKQGHVYRVTDEVRDQAGENRVSVPDLHTTILHQLGLDHDRIVYNHTGRDETLTDSVVTGNKVNQGILDRPVVSSVTIM